MIYNTSDNDLALELLGKYEVKYIYIGTLERETYESGDFQKFALHSEDYMLIYDYEGATIYEIKE